jgi:hypothetical protein
MNGVMKMNQTQALTVEIQKPATLSREERRGSHRVRISRPVRVRPSDPARGSFDEVVKTEDVSLGGLYFQTSSPNYELGMRLFVTYPYDPSVQLSTCEYLAVVVRIERLEHGRWGVAVRYLMQMNLMPTGTVVGIPFK